VEGAVDRARVDEVRATNIALTSQLAEQKKRFEAIESEQVRTIAAERDSLNAKLTAIQVDQGVLTVATKKGLRPTAIPLSEALSATSHLGLLRIPISYRFYAGFDPEQDLKGPCTRSRTRTRTRTNYGLRGGVTGVS